MFAEQNLGAEHKIPVQLRYRQFALKGALRRDSRCNLYSVSLQSEAHSPKFHIISVGTRMRKRRQHAGQTLQFAAGGSSKAQSDRL